MNKVTEFANKLAELMEEYDVEIMPNHVEYDSSSLVIRKKGDFRGESWREFYYWGNEVFDSDDIKRYLRV